MQPKHFPVHSLVHSLVRSVAVALLLGGWGLPLAGDDAAPDPFLRAEALYPHRDEGHQGGHGAPETIAASIAAYEQALAFDPDNLEVRWKLLRALYFQGEHVQRERAAKRQTFDRGREVFEGALDLLAEKVGGRKRLDALGPEQTATAFADTPDALPTYFWGAVSWGLWGEAFGKVAAVRQGVAGKLKHYIDVVMAIDPMYSDAGGHRLKGRFHSEAPRIPFFTPWVSRETALAELHIAWETAPQDPLNGLYPAEAILDHAPRKRSEAIKILDEIRHRQPRPEKLVEDLSVVERARHRLEALAP